MPDIFKPGKITFVLDGGAGSSGKGIRAANMWKYHRAPLTAIAINTFLSNAAHTIQHADGREYVHQCLSSVTTVDDKWNLQYLGPGCGFAVDEFLRDVEQSNLSDVCKKSRIKIHPNVSIVTQKDIDYEKGLVNFDGDKSTAHDSANLRIGSTLHGVGAARARRILRRPDAVIAKNVPELQSYIQDCGPVIMSSLDDGYSALGEIAQGYQLSLYSKFYPCTTSRNCSVMAFMDDAMLPLRFAGPVVLNFRTYPIRVNDNKYVRKSDDKILTWDEYASTREDDRRIVVGYSGGCYPDQQELTWDQISESAGEKIFECTSLTKLPRRVFSFSRQNMDEAMIYNNTGDDMYLSINFMNYVDASVKGKRNIIDVLTPKVRRWLCENIFSHGFYSFCDNNQINFRGLFIGTWKTIDDSLYVDAEVIRHLL